jgi:hypothetical protein
VLPAAIGRCTRLQKLMLAGNRLRSLPPEMAACTRSNCCASPPISSPGCPAGCCACRLAWLAYAGNPFCAAVEQAAGGGSGRSGALACAGPAAGAGEGASGVIHRAAWQDGAHCRDVAVKLFKGAVTSDGLPSTRWPCAWGRAITPT